MDCLLSSPDLAVKRLTSKTTREQGMHHVPEIEQKECLCTRSAGR